LSDHLPHDNADFTLEKNKSLAFLKSLFGGKEDSEWIGQESVDSEELDKEGAEPGVDPPMDVVIETNDNGKNEPDVEMEVPLEPSIPTAQHQTNLNDLFAPEEENG